MKRYFFLLVFSFAFLTAFPQKRWEELKDTIVWNSAYRLVKADFKAKPAHGTTYGMTVSGLRLDPKEDKGTLTFTVQAIFYRIPSWLRSDSEYELKHEQDHFDITEIYARKLRKKISEKHFTMSKKLTSEIEKLYKDVNEDLEKEQDRYDNETEHSIKKEKQEQWNKKIASELEDLKDFAEMEVHLNTK